MSSAVLLIRALLRGVHVLYYDVIHIIDSKDGPNRIYHLDVTSDCECHILFSPSHSDVDGDEEEEGMSSFIPHSLSHSILFPRFHFSIQRFF